jgi:hypothetical protein
VGKGQTLNEYSYETEVQQGRNIAEAASTIEGLELFIWSTLVSPREISRAKWTWVFHFDSKAAVERYIKQQLPALSAKTSYFIPGAYVANLERFWKPAKVVSPDSNIKYEVAFADSWLPMFSSRMGRTYSSNPDLETSLFIGWIQFTTRDSL